MFAMIIKNGHVFDPLNEINGEIKDVLIKDGKIVAELSKAETQDATSISSGLAAGTMLQKLVDDDVVNSAVFNSDGSKLATASDDNTTRIWDVAT
jgi:formylmethanofuran dehydrogenase subunit A